MTQPTTHPKAANPVSRRATDARISEIEACFTAQYPIYQYRSVEFIVSHLADLSREFGGDLHEVLVLAVIGQIHLRHVITQPADSSADKPSISASRLADVTAIPRQTVRRKLAALAARGWIEDDSSASWRLRVSNEGSPAQRDLSDLDKRKIRRLAELFAHLEALLPKC